MDRLKYKKIDTIKQLKDGEFGVSLKEDADSVKYLPEEEVEIWSTWVKAKWTRASVPVPNKKIGTLKHLGFHKLLDIKELDSVTVRNDVDDATLDVLLKNNVITKDLHEYFVHYQVDEIIFRRRNR